MRGSGGHHVPTTWMPARRMLFTCSGARAGAGRAARLAAARVARVPAARAGSLPPLSALKSHLDCPPPSKASAWILCPGSLGPQPPQSRVSWGLGERTAAQSGARRGLGGGDPGKATQRSRAPEPQGPGERGRRERYDRPRRRGEQRGRRVPGGLPGAHQPQGPPARTAGLSAQLLPRAHLRLLSPLAPSRNRFSWPLRAAQPGRLRAGTHRVSQRSSSASPFATGCQLPGCRSIAPAESQSSPRLTIAFLGVTGGIPTLGEFQLWAPP